MVITYSYWRNCFDKKRAPSSHSDDCQNTAYTEWDEGPCETCGYSSYDYCTDETWEKVLSLEWARFVRDHGGQELVGIPPEDHLPAEQS